MEDAKNCVFNVDNDNDEIQAFDKVEAAAHSFSSVLLLFTEEEDVVRCIDQLSVQLERDTALQRLRTIYDKYLECPTLLDQSLESVIQKLAAPVQTILHAIPPPPPSTPVNDDIEDLASLRLQSIYQIQYHLSALYALSKVRGRKYVQRFLPHGVHDVEPVWKGLCLAIQLIQHQKAASSSLLTNQYCGRDSASVEQDGNFPTTLTTTTTLIPPPPLWESLYMLWIWMSTLSLVPFDCQVLWGSDTPARRMMLLDQCVAHFSDAGPVRTVAATCLASWLSRPDWQDPVIPIFVDSTARIMLQEYTASLTMSSDSRKSLKSNCTSNLFGVLGVLQTLTTLLKQSSMDRVLLVVYMRPLWQTVLHLADSENDNHNLLLKKLLVKWWTRMSCTFLPPRIAAWRYQRGQRSLFDNIYGININCVSDQGSSLENAIVDNDATAQTPVADQWDDDLFFVPDEVEDAMGRTIETLSHPSTIVRWSAAKGVGRITERLPVMCAQDVLDAVLELFDDFDQDQRWHGACLALAELARRGLLLPNRLGDVVPFIVRAIHYDRRHGQTSVGSHVRDAACYTYWAFARAYNPDILRPYLAELSQSIILTSLFDREVNCRRSASAAFQEAVGRQGATNFPHGIAILTTADYFSLGNRAASYLSIAMKVAEFEEHRKPIIRHLYKLKLFHWDQNIRALVSRSLHDLTSLEVSFICSTVISSLLEKCLDEKDLYTRHGAVLGVAEITLALAETNQLSRLSIVSIELLKDLVPAIEKKRLYRGRGGEIMRSAVCRFIECMCLAQLSLSVKEQVRLLDSIDANIPHPSEAIQNDACRALEALLKSYFPVGEQGPSERLQKRVVDKFVEMACSNENPAVARGCTLALGYLPAKLLAPNRCALTSVLDCLRDMARQTSLVGGESDAETRRNCLLSLNRIIATVGFAPAPTVCYPVVGLDAVGFSTLFAAFLSSFDDYRTDRRGDVGSWCRMAAMEGVTGLVLAAATCDEAKLYINDSLVTGVVGALLKQLSEKLGTVRQRAGDCLARLLFATNPTNIGISEKTALIEALGYSESEKFCTNWSVPSQTFPLVMKAASLSEQSYFENVIAGIVTSVGGLTEDVSKNASLSLLHWAKEGTSERREHLSSGLLRLLGANSGSARLVLPILKTLDVLFAHGCLDEVTQSSFGECCQRSVEREAACKDVPRLFAVVDVTVALLTTSPGDVAVTRRALAFLCKMLAHPFPRIRGYTAQHFYLFLLEYDGGRREEALELILNTPWASETVNDLRDFPSETAERLDVLLEFKSFTCDVRVWH